MRHLTVSIGSDRLARREIFGYTRHAGASSDSLLRSRNLFSAKLRDLLIWLTGTRWITSADQLFFLFLCQSLLWVPSFGLFCPHSQFYFFSLANPSATFRLSSFPGRRQQPFSLSLLPIGTSEATVLKRTTTTRKTDYYLIQNCWTIWFKRCP